MTHNIPNIQPIIDEFITAIQDNDYDRIQEILKQDPDLADATTDNGETSALAYAIRLHAYHKNEARRLDIVRTLLEHGAIITDDAIQIARLLHDDTAMMLVEAFCDLRGPRCH